MEYKKLAFFDEVPIPSDTPPVDVTTAAASAGVSAETARQDHKHDIAVKLNELDAPDAPVSFNSQKGTNVATPEAGGDIATKDFVESLVQGLDWQNSVKGELADPPGTPAEGDRYIIIAEATGDWVGHENDITEYIDSAWVFFTPNEGFCCRVEDVDLQKVFNGTAWVTFGSTVDHGNLNGLGDDDHSQYHNVTRANTWLGEKAVNALSDITSPGADIEDAVTKKHDEVHAVAHKSGGAQEIKLHEFGEPTAKVPFAGQQGGDFVLENLAADPATPVLGKIYFKTGDLHPYVCTSVA